MIHGVVLVDMVGMGVERAADTLTAVAAVVFLGIVPIYNSPAAFVVRAAMQEGQATFLDLGFFDGQLVVRLAASQLVIP